MDQLKEIINIVSKQKIKNLDILTLNTQKGKMYQLYEGVQSGRFNTDEEAMGALYDGPSAKGSYRKLKERLMQQLQNTVLFVSTTPGFDGHQKLHYECLKSYTAVEILVARGARKAAVALAKKTIKQSVNLELTFVTMQLAAMLRRSIAYDGDTKKFEKYNILYKKYAQIYEAESLAREYNEHLSSLIGRTAMTGKVAPLAKKYEEELRSISLEESTSLFYVLSHSVYVNRCEFENDQVALQKNCQEAIRYLESKDFVSRTHVFFFLFKSLNTYLRFRQFEEGRQAIRKCLQLMTHPSSRNGFLVKEQYVLLCFYCHKYQEGYLQFSEVINNKGLTKITETEQERWEMYKGYFDWFKRTGRLDDRSAKKDKTTFKLGKFLNMVPVFSKDKEGFNAAILILQLLFLIQMKNYDVVIDKAEALKAYAYRYLKKKHAYRTFCFVNMLLILPASYFNKVAVLRKGEKWFKKMASRKIEESFDVGSVEIVPYETLWEMILEQLDEGFHKPPKLGKRENNDNTSSSG